MRGADTFTESLFTMRHLDDFVPADTSLPFGYGPANACKSSAIHRSQYTSRSLRFHHKRKMRGAQKISAIANLKKY